MNDDLPTGRLVYRIEIDVPPDDVWHAITDPVWTRRFFHDTAVHTSWKVGAPISYDLPDGEPAIVGTIVEFTPPRRFVMTTRFVFDPEAANEVESIVSWEVAPCLPDGTMLTLTHERLAPRTLAIVRGGWTGILADLHRALRPGAEPTIVEG